MFLTVTPNPCIDKTIFIPKFNPGDRIRSKKYTQIAGGKGNNVARVLVSLGFKAGALVWVGGYTGKQILHMLKHDDRITPFPVWTSYPSRTITTILEEEIGRQTAFFEPGPTISQQEYDAFINKLHYIYRRYSIPITVFSGTVPDKNVSSLYQDLIPIAHNQHSLTILDTYGDELKNGIQCKPYMIKPNVEEAQQFLGTKLNTWESKITAVQTFQQKYKIPLVVLSMGKLGAIFSDSESTYYCVPPKIKEINPVGSGDALVAGCVVGLFKKLSLADMGRFAVALGTANALCWDIGKIDHSQLQLIYSQVKVFRVKHNNQKSLHTEHIPLHHIVPMIKYSSQ